MDFLVEETVWQVLLTATSKRLRQTTESKLTKVAKKNKVLLDYPEKRRAV